jgi:DNA polymerase III delta prime subunit
LAAAFAGFAGSPTPGQMRWTLVACVTAGILAYITAGGERPAPSAIKRAALAPFRNEQRSRTALVKRVRSLWIQGVLEPSLHQVPRIELGMRDKPDAVDREADWIGAGYHPQDGSIPVGTTAFDVFEQADNSLLIMGEPGAGKTTMMLELARDLLDRAEHDGDQPIPVVFNLASWSKEDQTLSTWLANELRGIYKVNPDLGATWVEGEEILPLLDGLDEVDRDHRERCVTAINEFHDAHGLLPLVVCTRRKDYERLGVRLILQRAVIIQPLTREQVREYVERAGSGPTEMLATLREDEALWELLESPLLLSVVTLAFQEKGAAPSGTGRVGLEERRTQLFSAYTHAMLERRGRSTDRYPPRQAVRWLAWLAGAMVVRGDSVLQPDAIDPSWLPEPRRRRVTGWSALAGATVVTLIGVVVGAVTHPRFGVGLLTWLSYFGIPGVGRVSDWLIDLDRFFPRGASVVVGCLAGLAIGLRARGISVPAPARPWMLLLRDVAKTAAKGALLGGPILATLALASWLIQQIDGGLLDALINAFISGAILGAALGCTSVLDPANKQEEGSVIPRRHSVGKDVLLESLRGLGRGLLLGVFWGAFGWSLLHAIYIGSRFEVSAALLLGVTVALGVLADALGKALRRGGTLLGLARAGNIPTDITRFLDFSSECLLLRKGSEGYIFVHRLLMEYFAELRGAPATAQRRNTEAAQKPA